MQQKLGMLQTPDMKYFYENFAQHFYKKQLQKQISKLLSAQPPRLNEEVVLFQLPEDFDLDKKMFDYDQLQKLQSDAPLLMFTPSKVSQVADSLTSEEKFSQPEEPKICKKNPSKNKKFWLEDGDIQKLAQKERTPKKRIQQQKKQGQKLGEIKTQIDCLKQFENPVKEKIDEEDLKYQIKINTENIIFAPKKDDLNRIQTTQESDKKFQKCKIKREKKDTFIRLQIEIPPVGSQKKDPIIQPQTFYQPAPIPILQEIPFNPQQNFQIKCQNKLEAPAPRSQVFAGWERSKSPESEKHNKTINQSPIKQRTSIRRDKFNTITTCCKCEKEQPRSMYLMINEFYICAQCQLKMINPLQDIVDVLCEGNLFVVKNSQLNIETQSMPFFLNSNFQQRQDLAIDIRCIQLSEQGMIEMTFPQSCVMSINNKQLKQTRPLQIKSCLHKRKDYAILVKNINCLRYGNSNNPNTFVVKQVPVDGDFRNDEPGTQYMFGLFLVKPKSIPKLIGEIQSSQINQGKEDFIERIRSQFIENEVHVDKVKVSLKCQYTLELIDIPARGKYCYHLQCFSLENFLIMMQRSEHKRWFCPICRKICLELEIDKYQQYIIMQIKKYKLDISEIKFTSNGDLDLPADQKNKILGQNPSELQMQLRIPQVQLGTCEDSAILIE